MGEHVSLAVKQAQSTGPDLGTRTETLLYAVTIFASAFLLFQVEPLIAKIIVPWFGGVAGVWTACLLFFQAVLLLGYLYAHLLTRYLSSRNQKIVHVTLLAVSLWSLPVIPKGTWKPTGVEDPAFRIQLLLALTIGLPYFLLSSTSPLLQAWYVRGRTQSAPYRFYALSNVGSMLALLSYPVLVEPFVRTHRQAIVWSTAYGCVALVMILIALSRRRSSEQQTVVASSPRPGWKLQTLWLALAACGSALLLAITNQISQNVAAVPFLWVLPLSLYLLSFILCFEGRAWYRRGIFLRLLGVTLPAMAYAMGSQFANAPLAVLIPLFSCGLFVCCMFCHGELARLKPEPAYLTSFYLMCSLGGAIGAVFVALLAPRFFSGLYELPIAIAACALLLLIVLYRDPESMFYHARLQPTWLGLIALVIALMVNMTMTAQEQASRARMTLRNFYGVLRVADINSANANFGNSPQGSPPASRRYRELLNGTINHGLQMLDSARRTEPTTYYSRISGIGRTLEVAGKQGSLRVGVIGLGVGTLAAYGRPGDDYKFYEINPLVTEVANRDFSFLRDSGANVHIVMGDARLSLEREPAQDFDVLAVDAFSSDSIPVHLLTREAFALYFRYVKPGGVVAVHVSNKYLNLVPVVHGAAKSLGKNAVVIANAPDPTNAISGATWVLISNSAEFFKQPEIAQVSETVRDSAPSQLWTDDYSSILKALK